MKHTLRWVGAGVLAAILGGLLPGSGPRHAATTTAHSPLALPPALEEAVRTAAEQTDQSLVDMDFLVGSEAKSADLTRAIEAAGGEVTVVERTYVRARVPAAAAQQIPAQLPVEAVGLNRELGIAPTQVEPSTAVPSSGTDVQTQAELNYSPMGLTDFRNQTGSAGRGIIVAVIDSGVDPGHPDLQRTSDGRPKLIDWQDFTREGAVATSQAVTWAATYRAPDGREFQLPSRPAGSTAARFGFLDESYVPGRWINFDLDRNGFKTDRFGVLTVDAGGGGRFDTVYVDTNNDGSFLDEVPLKTFRQEQQYASLGRYREGQRATRRLNFVVAAIDPGGKSVQLGFDGLGHGTQVAGVLGANNPAGFTGVAPGVQIMALKAIRSTESGDWFDFKDAILYAAKNGAKIINLSVGGLAAGAARYFDTGASEWLNQVASDYGVLIVMAAANNGPGLSSGATLGNPSSVLAVGSYYSPEMWRRDYNWVVPHESIWFFSGMGPRSDGSYLPSLVAPGGSPVTSPMWRDPSGYFRTTGTSIATPHVSGAAALLMEAARRGGHNSDWLSVKRALEMGARTIPGFAVFEQGHGLVQMRPAFSHLQQINSVPALKARMPNGDGGLLARSYTPGSALLVLTNQDRDLSRVGIFPSEKWVRPALTSMTLPPDVARSLPLSLDPPRSPGVHSAFVGITHQNKYGPSLVVPITYVKPEELSLAEDSRYTTTGKLESGRYQRHFFNVKPGTGALSVTARTLLDVPENEKGAVRVHIFRPDGQPVHNVRLGGTGDGVVSIFETEEPVAGVWEVVIVALPDARETYVTPGYGLDVKARSSAVGVQPLRFVVPADSVTTHPVKVSNVFGAFTGRVEAIGLTRQDPQNAWTVSVPWRVETKLSSLVETFTLKEFTNDLLLEISNPVRPEVDLNLQLFRVRPDGVELVKESSTAGTSKERIPLTYVSAGTYRVQVTGTSDPDVQFQYRRLVGVDNYLLQTNDVTRRHERGEVWSSTLTIKAPATPGRYTGYLLMRESGGSPLGWFPIEVSVGQPSLKVEALVSQLTAGKPSTVVLQVRDMQSRKLVNDATLVVNGQRFMTRNGQVSIPVLPQGSSHLLEVEANLPAYQFVSERITIPVKQAWGLHPVGSDGEQVLEEWRRKLQAQLP